MVIVDLKEIYSETVGPYLLSSIGRITSMNICTALAGIIALVAIG